MLSRIFDPGYVILAMVIPLNIAANICNTHEVCPSGQVCQCTIIPSSAYDRYFYFDIDDIKRGVSYQCHLNGGPSILSLVLDASRFPQGSKMQCLTDCSRFPITFQLDTEQMTAASDQMVIKYFVPASDIPDEVQADCIPLKRSS